ncbi:hypothetical protein NG798_22470 [Ancylothrix sp. C2]|uniref:hypothetical protein n=1 Tax=Ancylothrix sp. D3o TaxID=2953691 RepID=UPI0021BA753B|nr:hypothetical protein [Ancylothrix sp. D3o]MCT7952565.1 hypothetical protein [Ancylothrix sp. D3o]
MNLLEIVESFEKLSEDEQDYLLDILVKKRKYQQNIKNSNQENFWEMLLRFRERMEQEKIVFTDEDFANLRERSPGREVDL